MKKISLLIVAFVMSAGMVMAQPPQRGGERKKMDPKEHAEKMTDRMVKEYSLNDTQKEKLMALNMSVTEKMVGKHPGRQKSEGEKVRPERKKDEAKKSENMEARKEQREKRMAEMKESRQAYEAGLKEILTEDQYNKYQANIAERQQKGKERGKDGRKGPHQRKAKA